MINPTKYAPSLNNNATQAIPKKKPPPDVNQRRPEHDKLYAKHHRLNVVDNMLRALMLTFINRIA